MQQQLDPLGINGYALHVPFNSGTGIGVPNDMADSRLAAIFTSVCNTIGAPFSTAGRGGSVLARAGFHIDGTPTPPRACHPRLASGSRSLSDMEATMPSIALRIVRALFPVFSVPVSTVPTHTQACAMARLLVSQGKRVAIVPAATGFTVSEVKA